MRRSRDSCVIRFLMLPIRQTDMYPNTRVRSPQRRKMNGKQSAQKKPELVRRRSQRSHAIAMNKRRAFKTMQQYNDWDSIEENEYDTVTTRLMRTTGTEPSIVQTQGRLHYYYNAARLWLYSIFRR